MTRVTFDPAKSVRNVTLPGRETLPFDLAENFDFDTALTRQDRRDHPETDLPYPEPRYQSIGRIGHRIVMLVHTPTQEGFRVISLRPADRKERRLWQRSR